VGSGNLAEGSRSKRGTRRRPELGVIEKIEGLNAEDKFGPLGNETGGLFKRQIHIDSPRPEEGVSSESSIRRFWTRRRGVRWQRVGGRRARYIGAEKAIWHGEVVGIEPEVSRGPIKGLDLVRVECLYRTNDLVRSDDSLISGTGR